MKPTHPPAFIADCHLGKLAKYLRLMGFDTRYFPQIDDNDLIVMANDEGRIILSRDRELCERKKAPCHLLRPTGTEEQLKEVVRAFRLETLHLPFSRCIVCNTPLKKVDKEEVVDRLPAKVKLYFSHFEICSTCDRVYWHGDHYKKMKAFLDRVLEEVS